MGELFDISNTSSFNADKLVDGDDYDYVTRTSNNQGVLRTTGFINKDNINEAGVWSLGLLRMDFFYRKKRWYAGQFVRKISPKIQIPEKAVPFITVILNHQKPVLSSIIFHSDIWTFPSSFLKNEDLTDLFHIYTYLHFL